MFRFGCIWQSNQNMVLSSPWLQKLSSTVLCLTWEPWSMISVTPQRNWSTKRLTSLPWEVSKACQDVEIISCKTSFSLGPLKTNVIKFNNPGGPFDEQVKGLENNFWPHSISTEPKTSSKWFGIFSCPRNEVLKSFSVQSLNTFGNKIREFIWPKLGGPPTECQANTFLCFAFPPWS